MVYTANAINHFIALLKGFSLFPSMKSLKTDNIPIPKPKYTKVSITGFKPLIASDDATEFLNAPANKLSIDKIAQANKMNSFLIIIIFSLRI